MSRVESKMSRVEGSKMSAFFYFNKKKQTKQNKTKQNKKH